MKKIKIFTINPGFSTSLNYYGDLGDSINGFLEELQKNEEIVTYHIDIINTMGYTSILYYETKEKGES